MKIKILTVLLFNFLFNMMNNVKSTFSIKDLENLSGIKAHTIRIWEKRYAIFDPKRTKTNIRNYSLNDLQKLLNISLLHDFGYKISIISTYSEEQIKISVKEIISEKSAKSHAISAFKMAMMNFDQTLFFNTYNNLLSEKTFREIFFEIVIPLMNEVGLLWQSGTITEAHEHFISYLIKQKLLINTERIQTIAPSKNEKVFVLYLPENEIHELGLMYLNYEILLHGYKTIYLGESVPIDSLKNLKNYFEKIVFVGYLTVQPEKENIARYMNQIETKILDKNSEVWFIGKMTQYIETNNNQISTFNSIEKFVRNIS